jgi:hypothetical protein
MKQKRLFDLSVALLDDENGISQKAWELLQPVLIAFGLVRLVDAVKAQNGRYYLPENWKGKYYLPS